MVIGICGKSGSGKTTLAKALSKELVQAQHLEIDKVGHLALGNAEVKKELIRYYGNEILWQNQINRKKLGEIVFQSRLEMKRLTEITWEYMQKEIDEFLSHHQGEPIVFDWLLLPITKYFAMCDMKVLLDIPYEIRKNRAMIRDQISEKDFELREKASISLEKKDFDYVITKNDENDAKRLVKLL